VWPSPAGRAAGGQADRCAAGPPGAVDPATDLAVPGPAAGQHAHVVPAGAAGGDLAAAQADRPRRPGHDQAVAAITARLLELPRRAVLCAEDETHLHLAAARACELDAARRRPQILTPGKNRQITVFGAIEVTTGRWVYRLGRRCAEDFIVLLQLLAEAFPQAPVIVVICDNDSIHHARTVLAYLEQHPRLELLYGARYSPHDNPVERIWAGLKNYVANTAVSWPGRLRQIHSFFCNRSPGQMLATAAPWTSPWLPPGYEQNFWNAAQEQLSGAADGKAAGLARSFPAAAAIRPPALPAAARAAGPTPAVSFPVGSVRYLAHDLLSLEQSSFRPRGQRPHGFNGDTR
jgi:hypothetical protein